MEVEGGGVKGGVLGGVKVLKGRNKKLEEREGVKL